MILLTVYVHIMCAIVWIGYVLFWLILTPPVERRFGAPVAADILGLVTRSEWPPRAIPAPFRLTFPQVAWGLLLLLALTGTIMAVSRGVTGADVVSGDIIRTVFGRVLVLKLAVVAVVIALQVRLARRPNRAAVYATSAAAFGLIVLSAILARVATP